MTKTRYRVVQKMFRDGVLLSPGEYIHAEPGIKSAALVEEPDASGEPVSDGSGVGAAPQSTSAADADTMADLRLKISERDEQLAVASNAISDLQGRLDALRAESDKRISDLEARLSANQAGQKQQQGQPGKAR